MKTNAVHMLAAIVGVLVGVGFAAEEPVEVRVRQCAAGPQIQVDGVIVPPRFFWGRTGLPPQTLKREWRRFELSLTPDHDIKRASLHFRFDETNGTTQVRNLQLKGTRSYGTRRTISGRWRGRSMCPRRSPGC